MNMHSAHDRFKALISGHSLSFRLPSNTELIPGLEALCVCGDGWLTSAWSQLKRLCVITELALHVIISTGKTKYLLVQVVFCMSVIMRAVGTFMQDCM